MNAYDPRCLSLANVFIDHRDGCICVHCDDLAQSIQDAVENYLIGRDDKIANQEANRA